MSTFIKPLNALNTKFSINGKLAVIKYSSSNTEDDSMRIIKYSIGLNEQEDKDFKSHLEELNII